MTNMHFNPTYEEVAFEQGEQNNKLQSSRTRSKLIYLSFVIFIVVILVQAIVLYFVLKPSSSEKQQIESHEDSKMLKRNQLIDNINNACTKSNELSKENIPSSFNSLINMFGINVDTSAMIRRIESTLTNYDQSTFGRAIHFKPTNECLNGGLLSNYSNDYKDYKVFPAKCDGSPFQQWRRVQNKFQVGTAANYPKHGGSFSPCLDCHLGLRSCDLIVYPCNDYDVHIFYIRIFPNQIDLIQKRVYFTIHNSQFFTQCLGRQYNEQYKSNVFYLQECTGNDDQSFYLQDLDFSEEIEDIKIKISSALWSLC